MARTIKPEIMGTGIETLYARVTEDFTLEIKIGARSKYKAHFTYKEPYMALCRARVMVRDLKCAALKIMSYPADHIPERG
jgi:hypothetical protein